MKPQLSRILCGFPLVLLYFAGFSQPAIEFASGSGPAGNGSSTASQLITFQDNELNPVTGTYVPLGTPVTATFAITNQQFTLPASQNPNGAAVSFGAGDNTTSQLITTAPLFPAMNYISAAPAADFSSTQDNIAAGMSMTDNYAVEVFTSCMGLYNANSPTSGTYYMGNLTITFSNPISDPVIHIVGVGGDFGALGFTTQLTLTTAGLTMTELSGSTEFSVTGGGTQIVNTSATPTSTTGAGAASGSVLINAVGVTSLTFELYLRGNGKTPTWSNAREHTGDAWLIGVSALNAFIPLPVGMTSFTAQPQNHSVDLQWTTATQENSNYFTVERSQDGANWTGIGQVAAAGNSQTTLQYNYVDQQPLTGTNYYRLQEVADDGSSVYSEIRNVNFASAAVAVSYYPNPTHDRVTISSSNILQSVMLTTIDGRILQTADGFAPGQSLDLSRYPSGMYFLITRTADGQSQVAKIERN
jgi:Secretion system C-terminal sorting domain